MEKELIITAIKDKIDSLIDTREFTHYYDYNYHKNQIIAYRDLLIKLADARTAQYYKNKIINWDYMTRIV